MERLGRLHPDRVMARATLTIWVVKELAAAGALVVAAETYTHDVITTVGVVLAALVSAAGGIAAARTARANRNRADELAELRGMLDRRRSDRRGHGSGTPAGEPPLRGGLA
jgi:hypothetical protein